MVRQQQLQDRNIKANTILGLTVGLGKHVQQVSAPELKKFNIVSILQFSK
jgi:hypothetical protein